MSTLEVYVYIREHPDCTRPQICKALDMQRSTAHKATQILIRDGWIKSRLEDPKRKVHNTNPCHFKVIR